MEKSIKIENAIEVKELRELHELANFNKALNQEEYMQIVLVYKKAVERLTKQAKEQGIII